MKAAQYIERNIVLARIALLRTEQRIAEIALCCMAGLTLVSPLSGEWLTTVGCMAVMGIIGATQILIGGQIARKEERIFQLRLQSEYDRKLELEDKGVQVVWE
jgi:hypothetical protein